MVSKQQIKVILVDDVSERSARVSEQLSEEGFEQHAKDIGLANVVDAGIVADSH